MKSYFTKEHKHGFFINLTITIITGILLKWIWVKVLTELFQLPEIKFIHAFAFVLFLRLMMFNNTITNYRSHSKKLEQN